MKDNLDADRKSFRSEIIKKKRKPIKYPEIGPYDMEEDFLLTHLSTLIAKNKKEKNPEPEIIPEYLKEGSFAKISLLETSSIE